MPFFAPFIVAPCVVWGAGDALVWLWIWFFLVFVVATPICCLPCVNGGPPPYDAPPGHTWVLMDGPSGPELQLYRNRDIVGYERLAAARPFTKGGAVPRGRRRFWGSGTASSSQAAGDADVGPCGV